MLLPVWKVAIAEEVLGRPFAEVDALSDAVAGVSAEEEKISIIGMGAEDGDEVFGDQDGAAPVVGDADVF